ncbi:lysozyme-like domain-containing protein [Infundibulicybe gibba]|nr:lysozyme-like domain-containing protein [Infundibulicybe gibba]
MKITSTVLAILGAALVASASSPHEDIALSARHSRLGRRNGSLPARSTAKRCKTHNGTPSSTEGNSEAAKLAPGPNTSDQPKPTGGSTGVINVNSNCGPSGATKETTPTSGPNGSIDWLNCGLDGAGWNPPFITVKDVLIVSLGEAVKSSNSPFLACTDFVPLFEKYGAEFGVPSTILASFAMQESTCNPNAVGGGGEQGLMQLTNDKCGEAPGGDCKNPDYNIRTGAKFFAGLLASNGGDLLLSIGSYNGWYRGLTLSKATAAKDSSCCKCQNDCDYLHKMMNGWFQNLSTYGGPRLGKYFNLDVCSA